MIKKIQHIFLNKKKQKTFGEDLSSPIVMNAKLLEAHSVYCRCGSLAPPTAERGDTYQCLQCGKQPEGPRYNLGQRNELNLAPKKDSEILHMSFYNDSIELLKNKKR